MGSEVFQLYLLLTLKDFASGGLNHIEARLRSGDKEAQKYLKTFQQLREQQQRALGTAAIGIGTLMLMRQGVKVAGDFEQAITDLKLSIEEVDPGTGVTNLQKLNDEMGRSQALAVRLGNTLPGSTQDFVQMMTVLKQGGMQTPRLLGGGAEAVANLAVITHSNPAELAKEYAQVGEMFQLQTQQEWNRAADVSAKLFRATGIRPEEQVAGLKFAQIRAGANLGLHGIEGYESLGRVLGTLRTFGLEGGFGGRELSRFLMQLASFEKNAAKLKKTDGIDLHAKGIDLQFFDQSKAGHPFLGFDNVFKQIEKLRVLGDEERIKVGEKVFTAEGTAIATAFMTAGEEGWKKINNRVDAVVPLQQQIVETTDTWNAKLENVEGTLKNLTATGFTPLLNQVKPVLDMSNELVGYVQQIAQAHPAIATILADIVGIGGVALTVAGAVKAGTTAWGLYTIASMAAARALQTEAVAAGEAAIATDTAALKLGRFSNLVGGLQGMSTIAIAVDVAIVGGGAAYLKWLYDKGQEYKAQLNQADAGVSDTYELAAQRGQIYGPRSREAQLRRQIKEEEDKGLGGTNQVGVHRAQLAREVATRQTQELLAKQAWQQFSVTAPRPFFDYPALQLRTAAWSDRGNVVNEVRSLGKGVLNDPNVLGKLLAQANRGELRGVEGPKELEVFRKLMAEAVGPGKFQLAQQVAAQDLMDFATQSKQATMNMQSVGDWFGVKLPMSLSRTETSLTDFAARLSNLKVDAPTFNLDGGTGRKTGDDASKRFSFKAEGGRVLQGVSYIGGERGMELFTPGQNGWVTPNSQLRGLTKLREPERRVQFHPEVAGAIVRESRGGVTQHITVHPPKIEVHVHVSGNADPEKIRDIVVASSKQIVDVIEDELARRLERHIDRS
jgi:TP901 family phage tail tape measure protein